MLKTLKFYIQQSWLLIVSSFVFGLLIAVTYSAWKPKIDENKLGKLGGQIKDIIGADISTSKIDGLFKIDENTSTEVFEVKNSANQRVGFAFVAAGPAYDIIELVIVVDSNCQQVLGYGVLVCNETPGFGDKIKDSFFKSQFQNIPYGNLKLLKSGDESIKDQEIIAISGATITSQGVINIFNNYLEKIKQQLSYKGLI
jgi:electron transport complex protein RnfG